MKSLFDKAGNAGIISRVNKLSADAKPLWGTMSVSQMLAHCQPPLRTAFGEHKSKRGLVSYLFGGMVKKKLMKDDTPFDRNLPTDPTFVVKDDKNFEEEKDKLVGLIKRFTQGPSAIAKDPHPFFGKMSPEEWDKLQWKHLDHHLRQFGV